MWEKTEMARRLGLAAPIVQGPFGGGISSAELTAAASNAGGLGSFGAHLLAPHQIKELCNELRSHTRNPFAINLWMPFQDSENPPITDEQFARTAELLRPHYDELGAGLPSRPERFAPKCADQIEALLEARPAVFSFVYGVPSPAVLLRCRQSDIVTIGTATTVDEAVLLERAGVDMIVATGFEAGGHRVSFLRPAEDSLFGTFALVPQVVDAVKIPVIAAGESELPCYPVQSWFTSSLRKAANSQGNPDFISMWAGQGTPLIRHRNAGILMQSLIEETTVAIGRLAR